MTQLERRKKMSKSIYERVINLRNRISLDGDDTIYEEDHLLLDEVLDYIENNEQRLQEKTYNDTVDIYRELEIGAKFKKQEKLLELYRELMTVKDELISLAYFDNAYYFIRKSEANLEKQIKELEKEIRKENKK